MRVTTLLALLFVLAAASQAAAAMKVIRFGKLIDGTGRVVMNAVVVVEDDRVQRVASGNVPIPPGAEIIDLSRYTGGWRSQSPVPRRRPDSGIAPTFSAADGRQAGSSETLAAEAAAFVSPLFYFHPL
jgi:hypothetical protein